MTQRPDQPPEGFMQDEPVPDIPLPPEDEPQYRRRNSSYAPPPYPPYPYREHQSHSWSHIEPSHKPLDQNIIKTYWRPAMAWQYFFVCLFDFLIAPAMHMWFYSDNINNYVQWQPISLAGSGAMYHAAMGVIIGVYVWSRGKEKINRIEH